MIDVRRIDVLCHQACEGGPVCSSEQMLVLAGLGGGARGGNGRGTQPDGAGQ